MGRRAQRARGVDGDAAAGAAHREIELALEADAGEAEAAADVRGRLPHRRDVVAKRVGLAVHALDAIDEGVELRVGAVIRHRDLDPVRRGVDLEDEVHLRVARVRHRVLHELVDGEGEVRLAVRAGAGARAERLHEAADLVDEDPRRLHAEHEVDGLGGGRDG